MARPASHARVLPAALLLLATAPAARAAFSPHAAGGGSRVAIRATLGDSVIELNEHHYRQALEWSRRTWEILREQPGGEAVFAQHTWQEHALREWLVVQWIRLLSGREPAMRAEAAELYRRARSGERWGRLVQGYTHDMDTWRTRGDLGFVPPGGLPIPFGQAMYDAELGEVQPPVLSLHGYHVGKVHEIRPPRGEQPELRRVSHALIGWAPRDPDSPAPRMELQAVELRRNMQVEVLDPALCDELAHYCEAAGPDPEAEEAAEE